MRTRPMAVVLAALAALALAACGATTGDPAASAPAASAPVPTASGAASADGTPGSSESSASTGTPAPAPGVYLTRAEYEADPAAHAGTKVVYFFHASWCPSCRATEQAIGDTGVPGGLTLVKADYDSDTDLRKQYGVTTQHTFVQVGPDGERLAIWTGSADGAAILAETV